jgi:hypothetical protein
MKGVTRIGIDVPHVEQLFTTFDPSPFHEHNLNRPIGQYIVSQAWDAPRRDRFVIDLSENGQPAEPNATHKLEAVVDVHFGRLATTEHQNLHRLLRRGVLSLIIGLCVLTICTTLAQMVDAAPIRDGLREGLRDGLSVFGWVANWRPAEILFYDWWPVRRLRNLYRRLAAAQVVPAGGPRLRPMSELSLHPSFESPPAP